MKLYAVEVTKLPPLTIDQTDGVHAPAVDPQGWHDFCIQRFGHPRDFFMPDTSRVYRSRSAATERVQQVRRWGGAAVLMVAEAEFVTTREANARRAEERMSAKLDRLYAQIRELEDA